MFIENKKDAAQKTKGQEQKQNVQKVLSRRFRFFFLLNVSLTEI